MSRAKINKALEKYYSTFGYDTGTLAYKRGGQIGFGRKYPWGGKEGTTWIPEIDETPVDESFLSTGEFGADDAIRQYWNEHPDELLAVRGIDNIPTGSGAMALAGIATGIVGDYVSGNSSMKNTNKSVVNGISTYGNNAFNGINDNYGLMMAMQNIGPLSEVNAKTYRNKTWGQDIEDALTTGINAGLSTGNWLIGAGATAAKFTSSLIQRNKAKTLAEQASQLAEQKNRELNLRKVQAAQNVDAANDVRRMQAFYNNPFEYAFGGHLENHGADWKEHLVQINAGGRHEENPYEGVPSGVAEDGMPNLVEEGEVIWNNEYVFSDRIKIPKHLANKYGLGGNLTFADAIKEVTKESLMRPNDPISNETNKAIVNEFMDEQEAIREKEQAKAKRELQQAYDEDFMSQMNSLQQGMPMAQEAPVQMDTQQPMVQEGAPVEGEPILAFGGHKFEKGSNKNELIRKETTPEGNAVYVLPNGVKVSSYREAQARVAAMTQEELNSYVAKPFAQSVQVTPASVNTVEPTYVDNIDASRIIADQKPDFNIYKVKKEDTLRGPVYEYRVRNTDKNTYTVYATYNDAKKGLKKRKLEYASTARHISGQSQKGYRDSEGNAYATSYSAQKAQKNINAGRNADGSSKSQAAQQKADTTKTARPNVQAQMPAKGNNEKKDTVSTQSNTSTAKADTTAKVNTMATKVDTTSTAKTEKSATQVSTGNTSVGNKTSVTSTRSGSASTQSGSTDTVSTKSSSSTSSSKKKDVRAIEAEYQDLTDYLKDPKVAAEDKQKVLDKVNAKLPKGKKVKSVDKLISSATDGVNGPVHSAMRSTAAIQRVLNFKVPNVELNPADLNAELPEESWAANQKLDPIVADPDVLLADLPKGRKGNGLYRKAPIIGTGLMAANSIFGTPDYSNADAIIQAARAVGTPVNIPVETIGDYTLYTPFDTRYLVNIANQNRAAATRGIVNTSAGNRSMDLLGNMALAHSNQQELGEIARQAYLANMQERARVAEFNRGTNVQNMSAINARNQAQANLNSQRQATALSGITSGYSARQNIRQDYRNDRDANIESFLDNLGLYGREQVTDNQRQSMIDLGYFDGYGDDAYGNIKFVPVRFKKGGNKKKRRF